MPQKQSDKQTLGLVLALSLIVLLGTIIPKSLAITPGIMGLILTTAHLTNKKTIRFEKFIFIPAISVVTLSAASIIWSVAPDESFERTWKLALNILPASLLINYCVINSFPAFKRYAPILIGAMIAAMAFLFLEYIFNLPIYKFLRGVESYSTNKYYFLNNNSVFVIMLSCPLLFYLSKFRAKKIGFLTLSLVAFTMPILLFTNSQSAQMAALFILFVLVTAPLFSKAKTRPILFGLFTILALTSPWLTQYAFNIFLNVYTDDLSYFMVKTAIPHRLEIWDFVSDRALQSPLWGHGIEATKTIKDFNTQEIYHPGNGTLHPHNFALQIWIEFGLIGVLLMCAAFYKLLNLIYAQDKQIIPFLLIPLIAILSIISSAFGIWQGWWLGLIIFITALTCLIYNSSPTSKNN